MKKLLSTLLTLCLLSSLFLGILTQVKQPILADPIYYYDRTNYWEAGDVDLTSLGAYIYYESPEFSDGYLFAYLTWTYPTSAPAILDLDNLPLDFTLDDRDSFTKMVDHDGDDETGDIEYTREVAVLSYPINGTYTGSITFPLLDNTANGSTIIVAADGAVGYSLLEKQKQSGTSAQFWEEDADDLSLVLGFATTEQYPPYAHQGRNNGGEITNRFTTTNAWGGDNLVLSSAFISENSQNQLHATLDFVNESYNPEEVDYVAFAYQVEFEPDPISFGVIIENEPVINDNDVYVEGRAVSQNDYLWAVYYTIDGGGPAFIMQDDVAGGCDYCTYDYEFDVDIFDLDEGDHTIRFYAEDYNYGDPLISDPTEIEVTIGGGGPGSGPEVFVNGDTATVIGNDVTVTGYANSQGGGFYINEIYYYLNFGGLTYMPAADGIYDETTEEFELELTDLEPGDYTLEFYTAETDGFTNNNSEGLGPVIINFTIINDHNECFEGTLSLCTDGDPVVDGDTVTITGQANSQGGGFYINSIYYYLNFGGLTYLPALDEVYNEESEEFYVCIDGLGEGINTIEFYTNETDGETNNNTEGNPGPTYLQFLVGPGDSECTEPPEDPLDPEISIPAGPRPNLFNSFIYMEGTAFDENGDTITRIFYTINGGDEIEVTPLDSTFNSSSEEFIINPPESYDEEIVDIYVGVENELAETGSIEFNDVYVTNDSLAANCVLSNVPSPTSNPSPTSTIECSSDDTITNLEYQYFDYGEFGYTLGIFTHISDLESGNYGENSVSAEITPSAPLEDALHYLGVIATTGTGKKYVDFNQWSIPNDLFIVEAVDNSEPTIKLNPILPNPITSTAPYITGSCQDVNPFDTNSTIATLQYSIDGGAWENIPPKNAPLDNAVEEFSFQLEEMSIGEYEIEIRCADSAGNDSENEGTNGVLEFEIIEQPEIEPEEVVITENFTTNALNSINETTAIWGNGYVRLKEKIMWSKEEIDFDNYPGRYNALFQNQLITRKHGNDIWYAKLNSVHRYSPLTDTTQNYTNILSPANKITQFDYFSSGGKDYLLVSNDQYGLSLHNLTDSTNVAYDITGFDASDHQIDGITRDSRSGRLGFYISGNEGGSARLYYINLNNTPDNLTDDTLTAITSTLGFDLSNYTRVILDEPRNMLIGHSIADGSIIKIHDNNTPTNTADDTRFSYDLDGLSVEHFAVNPTSGDIYYVTQANVSRLFILTSNGTPLNSGDDQLVELTDSFGLLRKQATEIQFLEGPEYVGAQLFITTSRGDMIYYNTNGSPTNNTDDTIIDLPFSEGLYPEFIGGYEIYDYNTIYANFHRSGFQRIDLNRSWEDTGDAVTITIPPEVRLFVNNISLEDVNVGPLVEDEDGVQLENNGEVGIQYFISVDDGVTYTEVSTGDLNYILEQDYRLKLKITLTKIGLNSQTPVINGFTLAYGAYQDETQAQQVDNIEITVPDTTFGINQNFTFTVTARDSLGHRVQTLNDTVNLQLQYFDTSANVSALTPVTVNLTNGVGTVTTAQINITGEFKILASLDAFTDESPMLTVSEEPPADIIPTLSFSTNRTTIRRGESAQLTWNTTNVVSLELNGTAVDVNGSGSVSPAVTTTYTMVGIDPDGDTISSGLTIVVLNDVPVSEVGDGEDEEDIDTPVEEEEPGVGTSTPLELIIPREYIEFTEGEKVRIEWEAKGNPDSVFIDYQNGNVTNSGFFEFYPQGDMSITITARRGNQIISKVITVKLVKPAEINILLPAAIAAAGLIATSFVNGGFFYYISIFVGFVIFKRRKYWGVVYNASKLNKIPFATVRVYKKVGSQKIFVTQTISDLEGKYGIPINETGEYIIEFIHEAYRTEIKELTIQKDSDIVLDVGMFEINKQSLALFTKMRIFFKEQAPAIMQFMRVVVLTLMLIGAYITIQIIQQSPTAYNYIVLVLYLVTIFLQAIVIFNPVFNTKRGRVLEIQTNRPVKGAIFRILYTDLKATYGVENIAMTNDAGVLKIRIKAGTYNYQISRTGYETDQGRIKIDNSGKILDTIFMKRAGAQSNENVETKKFGEL